MIDATLREADAKMAKAVEHAREEFAAIRTGRAHPSMFAQITADYYGQQTPLQQLAGFQVPEPRVVIISPYDISAKGAIEKARNEGRRHETGRGRVAVIGASLLGVEVATTLRQLGLGVDLVFAAAHPWRKFAGETAGRFLTHYLVEKQGIKVRAQTVALRLEGDGRA